MRGLMRGFPCSFPYILAKSFQVDFAFLAHTVMDLGISLSPCGMTSDLCAHHFVTSLS